MQEQAIVRVPHRSDLPRPAGLCVAGLILALAVEAAENRNLYEAPLAGETVYIDASGRVVLGPFNTDYLREGLGPAPGGGTKVLDSGYRVIVVPQFDRFLSFDEGMAATQIDGKWGYVDETGRLVIKPRYDDARFFHEGLALVGVSRRFHFIDKSGRPVLGPELTSAYWFSEGLAAVLPEGNTKWGYMDRNGRLAIEPRFDAAYPHFSGLAVAQVGRKCGFIDTQGNWVVKPYLDGADRTMPFYEGVKGVLLNGKWGLIDSKGRVVVDCLYQQRFRRSCSGQGG